MEDKNFFKGIIPPLIIFFALILLGFIAQWLFPFKLMFHTWPTRLIIGIPLFKAFGLVAINALLIMKKSKTAVSFNSPTKNSSQKAPSGSQEIPYISRCY